MPTEVLATPRAEQQISRLRRKQSKTFENFLNDLAATGCRALAYRLSGQAPLDHMCVKHLSGSLRVVVAFEASQRAWVLLVGPHNDHDPTTSVAWAKRVNEAQGASRGRACGVAWQADAARVRQG